MLNQNLKTPYPHRSNESEKKLVIAAAVASAIFAFVLGTMKENKPESLLPAENTSQTSELTKMRDKPTPLHPTEKFSIAEEVSQAKEFFSQKKYAEARDTLLSIRLKESTDVTYYRTHYVDYPDYSREFQLKDKILQDIVRIMFLCIGRFNG